LLGDSPFTKEGNNLILFCLGFSILAKWARGIFFFRYFYTSILSPIINYTILRQIPIISAKIFSGCKFFGDGCAGLF